MRAMLVLAVAAATLSISAVAEEDNFLASELAAMNESFSVAQKRLTSTGFSAVKVYRLAPLRVIAFDSQGSEVLLTLGSQGEIRASEFVRAMDR